MKKRHHSYFTKFKAGLAAHKILWTVIVVTLIVGGYEISRARAAAALNVPEYTLAAAHVGMLQQTVSGTGQVSASNQTDIQSQVSGTIESINVSVGQSVKQGQLIATIDPTNALTSLENAKLSLAKLQEPAKETDLSNAKNSVAVSYNNAFDAASSAYLDLPNIMNGLKDLLFGQTGFLSNQKSSFLSPTATTYRDAAEQSYNDAVTKYASSLNEFKGLSRSSDSASLAQMYADTYATMKSVADAASKAQTAVTYITTTAPDYDPKDSASAASSANSYASQANSDTSSLLSAQNSIASASNSLDNLVSGPDAFDLQSAQTSVAQAQRTYEEYFVRAPYDGMIGRIPVSVYGQAGGSTAIATIVGQQKIASISLNEVDAAKVSVGQPVTITFDAIDGLNATGTVSEVDQVGTVTQGVVSYGVKILINTQDPRIKPGMSVNTTIITKQENNVLLIPSTAIKTQGTSSYVQVATLSSSPINTGTQNGTSFGTTTRRFGNRSSMATSTNGYGSFASSTGTFGSTTRSVGNFGGTAAASRTMTVPAASATVRNVQVTLGDSDDTDTIIVSGLNPGQFVVTRTSTGSSASGAAAPSLLQSLGGNRGGAAAGGANRTFGGGAGGARPTGAVRIGG